MTTIFRHIFFCAFIAFGLLNSSTLFANSKEIKGQVTLAAKLQKSFKGLKKGNVIYVMAYPTGSKMPMPAAVVKIDGVEGKSFPIEFTLSESDVMMKDHGSKMEGSFRLRAKLSMSGDAMTTPGDFIGDSSSDSIAVGTSGVKIELSEIAP